MNIAPPFILFADTEKDRKISSVYICCNSNLESAPVRAYDAAPQKAVKKSRFNMQH